MKANHVALWVSVFYIYIWSPGNCAYSAQYSYRIHYIYDVMHDAPLKTDTDECLVKLLLWRSGNEISC